MKGSSLSVLEIPVINTLLFILSLKIPTRNQKEE